MTERPLPGGKVFLGPVGETELSKMVEVGVVVDEPGLPPLRAMSPYAVVGRQVRVPGVPELAGKVGTVWAVHRQPGMVWVALNNHAHPAHVIDLEIVVASPHLCGADLLCCDDCLTHLGCRCPEPPPGEEL